MILSLIIDHFKDINRIRFKSLIYLLIHFCHLSYVDLSGARFINGSSISLVTLSRFYREISFFLRKRLEKIPNRLVEDISREIYHVQTLFTPSCNICS